MGFRYVLRYYIDPGFQEDERIQELADFCRQSRIEEVMLFHNPEECYQGYSPENERSAWIALAKKTKRILQSCGIAMSVNPWSTLVHRDRGRTLPERLKDMKRLVGETGLQSTITACPFSRLWIQELSSWFARIAAEVAPTAIWVEDDWRLHNFGEEFGYGGCFCPEHLAATARLLHLPEISREELLQRIADNDLEARQAWIRVCNESLMAPGRELQQAVRRANPSVRLGLMRGLPDVLSIEGADWKEYKAVFSPDAPLLIRPHMPPYTEDFMMLCLPEIARQTAAEFEPEEICIFPEMESSPRSGRYSKSAAVVAWECLEVPIFGSQGITVNHFDMMGNGTVLDRGIAQKLSSIKPRLDAITALGCSEANACGINVLFHPQVASYMKVRRNAPWLGLMNNSVTWGMTFGILGISHRLVRWENFSPAHWNAVSGDTIAALNDEEIRMLLQAKLLLDADSIRILCLRGFQMQLGIHTVEDRTLSQDGYAYEEIQEADPSVYGVAFPRLSAQRVGEKVLKIEADGQVLSRIIRFDKTPLYPGLMLTRGQYLLSAWPMEQDQFYMGYFNRFRRILLQRCFAGPDSGPLALGGDFPCNVYLNRLAKGYLLAIGNPTHDPAESIDFTLQGVNFQRMDLLQPDGTWQEEAYTVNQNHYHLEIPLSPLEFCHLRLY